MKTETLKQYSIFFLLAISVIASGCMSNDNPSQNEQLRQEANNTQQQTQELQTCGRLGIEILEASASEAIIEQNIGNEAIGEIEVTWILQNGETTTKTVSIDRSRGVEQANSGLSGTLSEVNAKSIKCQGIEATYP